MSQSFSFFSPAKLNLFFRILNKRKDGYHEIATLMQAVNFGDILQVSLSNQDKLTCNEASIDCGSDNLIMKALELFRKKTKLAIHADFKLSKKIPTESGLGGGSSNAATTLWVLNELTEYGANAKELKKWGGELGADVPFFFSEGSAYCTGVGGKVNDHAPLQLDQLWIAKPQEGLSTPLVFKLCEPPEDSIDPVNLLSSFQLERPTFLNDLEEPAFILKPELETLKFQLLDLGFDEVMMTGSGTAFVCMGEVSTPELPDVQFFQISPIHRKSDSWYSK